MEIDDRVKKSWYHFSHWIFAFYILLYIPLIQTDFVTGLSLVEYINFIVFTFMPSVVLSFIVYKKYNFKDFRFKLFLLMLMNIIAAGITIFILGKENTFVYSIIPDVEHLPIYLISVIIATLIVAGGLFSIIDLTTKFGQELEILSGKVAKKEYKAQIQSSEVMQDGVFAPMANFVNGMVSTTGQLIGELTETANLIAIASEELSSSAEEVNASSEEVSSTSQSMSIGASQQAELISGVVESMKVADNVIDNIIDQVKNNTSAVSQIALQTNILALNAGIEASRAGDYGRGFAVVAENVRKLSDESKNSSDQIAEVVQTISVTLKELFIKMQSYIENVAAVSEETAASSQQVAAAAEEMAASMEQITESAVELAEKAFKLSNLNQ